MKNTTIGSLVVLGLLIATGCDAPDVESIASPAPAASPKEAVGRTKQALETCLDPNDPNTCIDCSMDWCPYGYQCDWNQSRCYSWCTDGLWSGDEGDVDCGGACSTKCTAGQHCWTNWDCASGSCSYDVCQP